MVRAAHRSVDPREMASHCENYARMLPEIRKQAEKAFADQDPQIRREMVSRAVDETFLLFTRLASVGLAAIAYPRPLARTGIRRVSGRVGQ